MHRTLLHSHKRPDRFQRPAAALAHGDAEGTLMAMAQAIELRDPTTGGHCERLAFHGVALGMAMGLSRGELVSLYRGGFLHDIGKVAMPDAILFKPSALDEEEWNTMRQHPLLGEEICRGLKALEPVLPIIRSHHERWDGTGYPDGLKGNAIPLLARVLQFADIYDALTAPRPYKRAYSPQIALEIMEEETARGWRDPDLMELYLRLHRKVLAAMEECPAPGGELASMEESLRRLEHHLAEDAGAGRKPMPYPASTDPRGNGITASHGTGML
jgi:putative two-component system response regulator